MKVKDLIVALASCDPDGDVIIHKPAAVRLGEYTAYSIMYSEADTRTAAPFHATLVLWLGDVIGDGRFA